MFSAPAMLGTAQAQPNPPPGGEQACGPHQYLYHGSCYVEGTPGTCPPTVGFP